MFLALSDLLFVLHRIFCGVLVPVPFFLPCCMLTFLCVLLGKMRSIMQIYWASTVELFGRESFNFLGYDFFLISKSTFYKLGLPWKLFKPAKWNTQSSWLILSSKSRNLQSCSPSCTSLPFPLRDRPASSLCHSQTEEVGLWRASCGVMWGDWKEPELMSPVIIIVSVGNEDLGIYSTAE